VDVSPQKTDPLGEYHEKKTNKFQLNYDYNGIKKDNTYSVPSARIIKTQEN
jgi:hypothetical protein